ncbi:MAG: DUF1405 domain-containing protein [Haloferacaceae archaeon]
MDRLVPKRYAERYLGTPSNLVTLLVINGVAFLIGLGFYVTATQPYGRRMVDVPVLLYPMYADSPTAIALATLALVTLLPALDRPLSEAPVNRPLAYVHTLGFTWLVKYGLWTGIALVRRADLYLGFSPNALWTFWGITITHLLFVVEAYFLPHAGRTTRGALGLALAVLLTNDVLDYGFGYHPPLRYQPGLFLAAVSVALSVLSVWLAARAFAPLDADAAGRSP